MQICIISVPAVHQALFDYARTGSMHLMTLHYPTLSLDGFTLN